MKITKRSCATVLVALLLTTAASANDKVDKLIETGNAAQAAFHLPQALEAFREAYQLDTHHYTAAWKYARALTDTATLTLDKSKKRTLIVEAESVARHAAQLNPKDSTGHTTLAIAVGQLALLEGGRRKVELSKEVKDESERAIALNDKDDIAYHVLAVWNREMTQLNWMLRKIAELFYGKFPPASLENARDYLQRATRLSPEKIAHHVELGITLSAERQYIKAEAELAQALRLPKTWVTDDHYRAIAEAALKDIAPHLK